MGSYELENVTLYPTGSLDNNNITFLFPAEQTSYWCPQKTDIFVKLRVLNGDGSKLLPGQKVYPSPAFACTLFQQLNCFYNETRIGQSNSLLPYTRYMKYIANYSSEVVATYLSRAMLFMTDISPADERTETNLQAETRGQYIAESKYLTLQWRLDEGFLNVGNFLPSGSRLRLELTKSDPNFSLMWPTSGEDAPQKGPPKIEFVEVRLIATRARPTASLSNAMESRLERGLTLKYVNTQAVSFVIPTGSHGIRMDDLFHGYIPNRALLTVVKQKSQQGAADLSPFCFSGRLRQITHVDFFKDARSLLDQPLTPEFTPYDESLPIIENPAHCGDYLPSYLSYLRAITVDQVPLANDISYQLFANSRTIFGCKPSSQSAAEGGKPILGNFAVELRFGGDKGKGADDYLSVICIGEFPGEVNVDKHRAVSIVQ